ncbi:TIM barrel protein [Haloarchaeobius sp. HRN-SO-5]|uniref:TIM barrel protein n=1 Tax=Haloarchaeobius sp. HRN-SO-5 TaxID=3446118 RepID=UPI003EBBEC42
MSCVAAAAGKTLGSRPPSRLASGWKRLASRSWTKNVVLRVPDRRLVILAAIGEKHYSNPVIRTAYDLAEDYDEGRVSGIGRAGGPRESILSVTEDIEPRYLVIGGHRRTPAGEAVFGSTTQSIIPNSEVPVVTVLVDCGGTASGFVRCTMVWCCLVEPSFLVGAGSNPESIFRTAENQFGMGVGYTTMMYNAEDIEAALGDISACRYDGVEIGIEKIRSAGPDNVKAWTEEYEIEIYNVMAEWTEEEEAVDRMVDDMSMIADLGAEFVGLLPPQRGRVDQQTLETWTGRMADAATDHGIRPLIHHHGATVVEQNDETRAILDSVGDLELLFDTAHYYPYGDNFPAGDVTDGIERFADDIAYVHLKDVDPVKDFALNRDALTEGDFHLDNVINYFRSFTDLGKGIIDFNAVYEALEDVGFDGHYTIEIENQTELPLVHAKENYDFWQDVLTSSRA